MNTAYNALIYLILLLFFINIVTKKNLENFENNLMKSAEKSYKKNITENFEPSPNIHYLLGEKLIKIEKNSNLIVNSFNEKWNNYALTFTIKPLGIKKHHLIYSDSVCVYFDFITYHYHFA